MMPIDTERTRRRLYAIRDANKSDKAMVSRCMSGIGLCHELYLARRRKDADRARCLTQSLRDVLGQIEELQAAKSPAINIVAAAALAVIVVITPLAVAGLFASLCGACR